MIRFPPSPPEGPRRQRAREIGSARAIKGDAWVVEETDDGRLVYGRVVPLTLALDRTIRVARADLLATWTRYEFRFEADAVRERHALDAGIRRAAVRDHVARHPGRDTPEFGEIDHDLRAAARARIAEVASILRDAPIEASQLVLSLAEFGHYLAVLPVRRGSKKGAAHWNAVYEGVEGLADESTLRRYVEGLAAPRGTQYGRAPSVNDPRENCSDQWIAALPDFERTHNYDPPWGAAPLRRQRPPDDAPFLLGLVPREWMPDPPPGHVANEAVDEHAASFPAVKGRRSIIDRIMDSDVFKHAFEATLTEPIYHRRRRLPYPKNEEERRQLQQPRMESLTADEIERMKTVSAWKALAGPTPSWAPPGSKHAGREAIFADLSDANPDLIGLRSEWVGVEVGHVAGRIFRNAFATAESRHDG